MRTPNTLIVGGTQWGKSTGVLSEELVPMAESGESFICVIDPHGGMGIDFAQHVLALGMGDRLIFESLSNDEHVIGWDFLERSQADTAIRREKQNRRAATAFADILTMTRERKLDQSPLIKEWTMAVIALWQYQKTDVPLTWIPYAFRPGQAIFYQLIDNCQNQAVAYKFRSLDKFNSQVALYNTIGPVGRLLEETFDEPAVKMRMTPTIDLYTAIKQKAILILVGSMREGGADEQEEPDDHAITVLSRALMFRIVQIVKRHYGQTHEPLPSKVVVDECAAYGMVGTQEAQYLATTTKMGLTFDFISQVPDFGDPVLNTQVEQNCRRLIAYHSDSAEVAKVIARRMLTTLDPHKEHHRDVSRKQRHAGFEEHQRITTTKTTSKKTGLPGTKIVGESSGTYQTPIYEDFTEERVTYQSLSDQDVMNQQEVMKLGLGECIIADAGRVYKHQVEKLEDQWHFDGLGMEMLLAHIEWQKQIGMSRPPVVESPTWEQTPPPAKQSSSNGGNRTGGSKGKSKTTQRRRI